MSKRASLVVDGDGRARCGWVGNDPEYRRYHDDEWGVPLHGDQPLFEKLSLEAFQAGLSWITILRRRDAFRDAFAGFDIAAVSRYDESDVERLIRDASIIRNRAKILATISNARITASLIDRSPGSLDAVMWARAPSHIRRRFATLEEVPAVTPESTALSRELRGLGFKFVGPTTMYALMQSTGMVDDHVSGCWRAGDLADTAR